MQSSHRPLASLPVALAVGVVSLSASFAPACSSTVTGSGSLDEGMGGASGADNHVGGSGPSAAGAPGADGGSGGGSSSGGGGGSDTCSPAARTACLSGDVVSFDSCDTLERVVETCTGNSLCVTESPTSASCQCKNHWTGAACNVCDGGWDANEDCAVCRPGYAIKAQDTCSCVRYVDAGASGAGDGLTWATAHPTLQGGILAAYAATTAGGGTEASCEVWVRAGNYAPTQGTGATATFVLKPGIPIYGGFSTRDTTWPDRDWANNKTILDGNGSGHVVTAAEGADVDGFVVTGGRAFTTELDDGYEGGGLIAHGVAATIRNTAFQENTAKASGGAAYIDAASDLTFEDCVFSANESDGSGGALYLAKGARATIRRSRFLDNESTYQMAAEGGAIMAEADNQLTVTETEFLSNVADRAGGAIVARGASNLKLGQCRFHKNHTTFDSQGGAVLQQGGTLEIARSVFTSNHADHGAGAQGGALHLSSSTTATLVNSAFRGNYPGGSAPGLGGAVYTFGGALDISHCTFYANGIDGPPTTGGAIYLNGTKLTLTSSIVWGNSTDGIASSGGTRSETFSNLQDGAGNPLNDNISADPMFVGGSPFDLSLQALSPSLDKAALTTDAPADDLLGQPRPVGAGYDQGAYERQ